MRSNKYLYLKYLYWRWIQIHNDYNLNLPIHVIQDYIKCEVDTCKEIENILSNKYPKLYKDIQIIMNREDSESLIQSRINGNYYSPKDYNLKELQQLRKWSSLGQRYFKKKNICRYRDISESKKLMFQDCVSRVQTEEREQIMKDIRKKTLFLPKSVVNHAKNLENTDQIKKREII